MPKLEKPKLEGRMRRASLCLGGGEWVGVAFIDIEHNLGEPQPFTFTRPDGSEVLPGFFIPGRDRLLMDAMLKVAQAAKSVQGRTAGLIVVTQHFGGRPVCSVADIGIVIPATAQGEAA